MIFCVYYLNIRVIIMYSHVWYYMLFAGISGEPTIVERRWPGHLSGRDEAGLHGTKLPCTGLLHTHGQPLCHEVIQEGRYRENEGKVGVMLDNNSQPFCCDVIQEGRYRENEAGRGGESMAQCWTFIASCFVMRSYRENGNGGGICMQDTHSQPFCQEVIQ